MALALAVVLAAGTFVLLICACTFVRGLYVGDGVAWEAIRWGFWGVGRVCFFGLRSLEVFDVEDFVERLTVVDLDNFGGGCEFFD